MNMMMSRHKIMIDNLMVALEASRQGDVQMAEVLTDRVRDASYSVTQRLAGYVLRSACGAIDAIGRAVDREAGLVHAEHEIEKARQLLNHSDLQTSAA